MAKLQDLKNDLIDHCEYNEEIAEKHRYDMVDDWLMYCVSDIIAKSNQE